VKLLKENSGGFSIVSGDGVLLGELAGNVKRLYVAASAGNLAILRQGRVFGIPPALLETGIFLEKTDYQVHRVLRAIALNKTVGNLKEDETVKPDTGLVLSRKEVEKRFAS
jgi:DNA polymerase-3 subunit alpha/error-prone DNA polymerase